MRIATITVAALVLAAAAAGAGRGAGRDACSLLKKAEVVAAIGEPLKAAKGGGSSTGAVFCNWTGKDSRLFSKGIALIAATDDVAARYRAYALLLKKRTPVMGVGVAAVTDGNVVLARSARAMVQVGPLYVGSGIKPATIAALAKKALARAG